MYLCLERHTMFPGSSVVEQATVNRLAVGSNPTQGAIFLSAEVFPYPLSFIFFCHIKWLRSMCVHMCLSQNTYIQQLCR